MQTEFDLGVYGISHQDRMERSWVRLVNATRALVDLDDSGLYGGPDWRRAKKHARIALQLAEAEIENTDE